MPSANGPLANGQFSEGVAEITLNNIEKRNALSAGLVTSIVELLDKYAKEGARVAILRAPKGSSVFSAGHDVRELPAKGRDPLGYNDLLEVLIRRIRHFPAPVMAMVEGTVWGGACEVCFACDIVVCENDVTFALTPARLGVPYNTTGLLNVRNGLGGRIAREMLYTAQPVPASRLYQMGIINRMCTAETLEETAFSMARSIARNSPRTIAAMKEQLRILDNAAPLHPEQFERLQGLRRGVYDSGDYEEGIQAFLEKRDPVFTGK